MTSLAFDLQVPATEIQIAEAIRVSDPATADIIRRLAFERDRLLAEREGENNTSGTPCQIARLVLSLMNNETLIRLPARAAELEAENAGLDDEDDCENDADNDDEW